MSISGPLRLAMKRASDSSNSTEKSRGSSFTDEEDFASSRQVSITSFFAAKPRQRARKRQSTSVLSDSDSLLLQKENISSASSSQSAPASPNAKLLGFLGAKSSSQNSKRSKLHQQTYLDFGQQTFGKQTLCQTCGMLFDETVEDDSKQHSRVCLDYVRGVPFQAEAPRIVAPLGKDTAIIEVRQIIGTGAQCWSCFRSPLLDTGQTNRQLQHTE